MIGMSVSQLPHPARTAPGQRIGLRRPAFWGTIRVKADVRCLLDAKRIPATSPAECIGVREENGRSHMVTMRQIEELSRRIAAEFQPQRIFLFGSYAWGQPTPDSDVDLLIVMPFDGKSVAKSVEMRLKVRPPFPVDLLVRTPDKVRERLSLGDPFIRSILEEGKVLYEADLYRESALDARRRCRVFRRTARSALGLTDAA